MIKHVALLKANPGLETGTFVDRYENRHAPLVQSLFPCFSGYRRSYVVPGLMVSQGNPDWRPDFDVVTQIWYENPEKLHEFYRAIANEATANAIGESEAGLFDQESIAMFECEEFVTPDATLQPRPAGHDGRPAIKLLGTIRKKAGMPRDAFIERYENGHCATALRVLKKDGMPSFAKYRRSFPKHDPLLPLPHMPPPDSPCFFDVMTEVWFWTEAHYQHFLAQHADERVSAILAEDEAQLFDRSSITMVSVEEHISI